MSHRGEPREGLHGNSDRTANGRRGGRRGGRSEGVGQGEPGRAADAALDAFKNLHERLAEIRARLPSGTELELWWQDEARVGQKTPIARRWARRGTLPRAAKDQRTKWADIFGAICPAKGKAAGLVMPFADTEAMQAHLAEIGRTVDPGAHAVLMLDQAGWHMSARLVVPETITLLPLPPRSPEVNPVETVWQFMSDNRLSNRVFRSYEDLVDHCCEAWNTLADQPWRIMTLGRRAWAHEF